MLSDATLLPSPHAHDEESAYGLFFHRRKMLTNTVVLPRCDGHRIGARCLILSYFAERRNGEPMPTHCMPSVDDAPAICRHYLLK